ncbi:metal ABC transporter solute-binding protein, Zn/Mn family [Castellaniella sp.]|uniref:metal ABC transporter solute-binding protein, Zn/Mn family n=1 Tax=Castellaniella sp. TaxID=1955812 RepID=UPI002AFFE5B0|nr:zinc ABC transporter substrate-binding protein [Castellaniella sp.]
MRLLKTFILAVSMAVSAGSMAATPVPIVAAENFYGDIAAQIGGARVTVQSILNNPDQDPHMFEASPSIARALTHARLVVYNGADYDPWMEKLLKASPVQGRRTVVAAELLGTQAGANPHLWYDPAAMPAVASAIARHLGEIDPEGRETYQANLAKVARSLEQLQQTITAIRTRHAGTPVTATEPVFGYMSDALGFTMRNAAFQLAVMNDTEPSASQIRAFEDDLKTGQVKILFYNSQEEDSFTKRVLRIAREHRVPIVGVTETMPEGMHFQGWVAGQLSDIETKLAAQQ